MSNDAINYVQVGDPMVTIMGLTPNAEQHMEHCARFCYNSLDKAKEGSHVGFLRGALKNGHFSILSHAHCTFIIEGISRACSHQLVRHAHLRYLQRSQRYCAEGRPDYIIPDSVVQATVFDLMEGVVYDNFEAYKELVEKGVKKEDARFVLPNACKTQIAVSGSLQAWWDFLRLRLDTHAQWEIRRIAKMVYHLLNIHVPNVFNSQLLTVQPKMNLEFPKG